MSKYLLLLLILSCSVLWGMQQRQEIADLAVQLAGMIDIEQPLFLELRTGEWTNSLESALRSELLLRGADLRESRSVHSSVLFIEGQAEGDEALSVRLHELGLTAASLVQINLEIGWITVERKSLLSYKTERRPVYNFTLKQISLPSARLTAIRTLAYERRSNQVAEYGSSRLRWFEPIMASLGLASMIFLLWTTE